ncbi:PilN domain-containing protein [Patescibacteria group bacterium]|nr:PilN domain-containing protein [Patescibacteria group bacterium]
MPKAKVRSAIDLNLLKPQGKPEKLPVRLLRWLLATGRYLFVFVEAIVLIAFAARFKLDADLAANKEAIEDQIPYIESLQPYETLIRQTQLKLSNIDSIKKSSLDYPEVLKKIADQTPIGVKISNINIKKGIDDAEINITGQTQLNNDLTSFLMGLKEEATFANVNLGSVGLENEVIKFTLELSAKGEKIYEK